MRKEQNILMIVQRQYEFGNERAGMKEWKKIWRIRKQIVAGMLAVVMGISGCMVPIPAYGSNIWPQKSTAPFYCLDGGKSWRASDRYEIYQYDTLPSPLTETQAKRLFWAYPSNWNALKSAAEKYDSELYSQIASVISGPNIVKRVKDDKNTMFSWVADHPEIEERAITALEKAAMEKAEEGKHAPEKIRNATSEERAVQITVPAFNDGPGALDTEFKLEPAFINDIVSIEAQSVWDNGSSGGTVGWLDASQEKNLAKSVMGNSLYEITWSGDSIKIHNNGSATANETALGSNLSIAERYNKTTVRYKISMRENSGWQTEAHWNPRYLCEWMDFKACVNAPERQRLYMADIRIAPSNTDFYLVIGQEETQKPVPRPEYSKQKTDVSFQIYRHEEEFGATYHVKLKKLDEETEKPLKGSRFYLYERFDSEQEFGDDERNGSLSYDKLSFRPWNGFQIFAEETTDESGEITHSDHRSYQYKKTYCDGHGIPEWADDESEDANRKAAAEWLELVDACEKESKNSGGCHFHWLSVEDSYELVQSVLETGEAEDAGGYGNAEKEIAFEQSGCKQDCEQTYHNFINLRFSYTWKESQARVGYILHGIHEEDETIEIISTNSSEAGADAQLMSGNSEEIKEYVWYAGNNTKRRVAAFDEKKVNQKSFEGSNPLSDELQEMGAEKDILRKQDMKTATASNGVVRTASNANAATASNSLKNKMMEYFFYSIRNRESENVDDSEWESAGIGKAFEEYLEMAEADKISHLSTGNSDQYSYFKEGCDHWVVKNHRTEGEIHINKRDMNLFGGENDEYSSYGDTEGDGTLEGAVYGLFAADQLKHPDADVSEDGTLTNTGIVYQKHDLVSIAVTDVEGNASFTTYTIAPGMTYDYSLKQVVKRSDVEWEGPSNRYEENKEMHGNWWIGRPLMMGAYYVKELSRSEGYELSVNGKKDEVTNYGANLKTPEQIAHTNGTAVISMPEWSASMESADGEGIGYDELQFSVTSSGTADSEEGQGGYQMVIHGLPENVQFYRVDSGNQEVTGPRVVGTEEQVVRDENGAIVWKKADSSFCCLKYEPEYDDTGKIIGQKPCIETVPQTLTEKHIPEGRMMEITEWDIDMSDSLWEELASKEEMEEQGGLFCFFKANVEEMLRDNGYQVPVTADGIYSGKDVPVFSVGVQKGDIDEYGMTTEVGQPAKKTVYGAALKHISIKTENESITVKELFMSIMRWYYENSQWSFGGVHSIERNEDGYDIALYFGTSKETGRSFFTSKIEDGKMEIDCIYAVYENPYTLRWVYQEYKKNGKFQYHLDQRYSYGTGTEKRYYLDAVLMPAMMVNKDGKLQSIEHSTMVYHKQGEEIVDYIAGDAKNGYRVPVKKTVDKIEITTENEMVEQDVPLERVKYDKQNGVYRVSVDTEGTDFFHQKFSDQNGALTLSFMIKLPTKNKVLSEADIELIGKGNIKHYQVGDEIGYAEYLIQIQGVSIGIATGEETGDEDTFIVKKTLIYKGQYAVVEDGNTKSVPVQMLERPIKQKIKVIKMVDNEEAVSNFRFKIYLKSNLEHLYCDENGMILWVDQFGRQVDIESYKESFPELVQKLDTRKTKKAVLECMKKVTINEDGKKEEKETYNYEKFFDAIQTANVDKWNNEHNAVKNTSWKSFAVSKITGIENAVNTSKEAKECAKRSDAVRQFAADWYLEGKIAEITKKLPNSEYVQAENEQVAYSEEIYDKALYAAILEAEEYLKVFFSYDLDSIYAICWDSEENGGIDQDWTTLSAEFLEGDKEKSFAYGISRYLPYGDYVLVEQQPYCAEWGDLLNRHYKTDEPKEISVPVFYDEQEEMVYSSLVPWSITEPEKKQEFSGYASPVFVNKKYRAGLRTEKIDGETGEPILHAGAVFALYKAERDDGVNGTGMVKRYEKETRIYGSKLFLQAMGASEITPFRRSVGFTNLGAGFLYSGIVPAGTPICKEEDYVMFCDENGNSKNIFEGLSTVKECADLGVLQTTGFFETPTPIEAGAYVLAELLAPDGYVRTKPVAVEVYSDSVVYYPDGDAKGKSAIRYGDQKFDGKSLWKMGEEEARIFIENTATSLRVSKVKTKDTIRRMKVSGRVEGSITALTMMYGSENLEFAYNSTGVYQGFGWKKGTREYLEERKQAGERVELVYEKGIFQGYGYVTKNLETADDESCQISGATMALFEAIILEKSGDTEDFSYNGLCVERDKNGNVISMYVKNEQTGEKTSVLYYDLGGLQVLEKNADGEMYGYDRNCQKIKLTFDTVSLFAIRNGKAEFEITGGNLDELVYDAREKAFTGIHEKTVIYHLDENLCRDSKVDPYMGLAFVNGPTEKEVKRKAEQIYVWPVTELVGANGEVIEREKRLTGRPGEKFAGTEDAYITGTQNKDSQIFEKRMNPVYDRYGLVEYYPSNIYEYKKGNVQYDRDGEYMGYRYEELLELYNRAAYGVLDPQALYDVGNPKDETDDVSLMHRDGEAWIIPNIWVTGEENLLRRVIPGTYILEELSPPDGYVRALPMGISVEETEEIQTVSMTDERIKIEIAKIDGTENYKNNVISNREYEEMFWGVEKCLGYSGKPISGVKLALFKAERVYTSDYQTYPKGYYLRKTEDTPASWYLEENVEEEPIFIEAVWISGNTPKYFEGIPAGDYVLEEMEVPDGYVPSSMEITVQEISELQSFILKNDHTKLEISKYERGENQKPQILTWPHTAEFALYPACLDAEGNVLRKDDEYVYKKDSVLQWKTGGQLNFYETMTDAYETMFSFYKDNFETFSWKTDYDGKERWMSAELLNSDSSENNESVVQLWRLENGSQMRAAVHWDGANIPQFEYQFNYVQSVFNNGSDVQMYDMESGIHRVDFIPAGYYILVEISAPDGYEKMSPELIEVSENTSIQRYWIENKKKPEEEPKGTLIIEKTDREDQKPLSDVWFEVKNLQNGEIQRVVTNEQGRIVIEGLSIQDRYESGVIGPVIYEIRELFAAEGYQKSSTVHQIRFRKNGQTEVIQYLKIKNDKTQIQINKKNFADLSHVSGATLAIYEAHIQDGAFIAAGEALERWISGDSSHTIIGKLSGGKTYLLVEEKVPDGYVGAKPIRFTLSEDGRKIIEISDSLMQVQVQYDEEAKQVHEISVTGQAAMKREVIVEADGSELMKVPASGDEIQWKEICKQAQWDAEKMENKKVCVKDNLYFTDGSCLLLGQTIFQFHADSSYSWRDSGIYPIRTEYVMKNADGIIVERWMIDDKNRTYTVENKKLSNDKWRFAAGQTYWIEEQVVFIDGSRVKTGTTSVQLDSNAQVISVDCVNRETEAEISKIALTTGEEIPGAVLIIRDEQGTVIEEWTSGTEKHRIKGGLEAGKTYILSEKYAADGYAYAEEISFTFHEGGGMERIVMEDRPTNVEFRKIDMTTGEELPGAELALRDSKGKLVDRWISGKNAHVISGILTAGETYTLQEITAPSGYSLAESVIFTVSLDGTIDRVVMENRRYENIDEPEEPKLQDKTKTYGTIIAKYSPDYDKDGVLHLGRLEENSMLNTPKTGDQPFPWNLISGTLLSLLGCVILFMEERNEKKHEKEVENKAD